MDLRAEELGGVTVLSVKGRVDSSTAPVLGQSLEQLFAKAKERLVVDFRELEYISSAGFRVLLVAAKRAEETGSRFVLCSLSAKVRHLFDMGGFLDLFAVSASRDDALTAAK